MSNFEVSQQVRILDTSFYDSVGNPGNPPFLVPGAIGTVTTVFDSDMVGVAIPGDDWEGFGWTFDSNEIEAIDG